MRPDRRLAWWASWLEWHNRELELQVARADRQAREAEKQTRIAEERRHLADRHHHAESLRRAREALDARQIELAQDILHDLQPEPDGDDLRGFAWRYLWRQAHSRVLAALGARGECFVGYCCSRWRFACYGRYGWDRADLGPSWLRVSRPFHSLPFHTLRGAKHRSVLERWPVPGDRIEQRAGAAQGIEMIDATMGQCLAHLVINAGDGLRGLAFDDQRRLFEAVGHEGTVWTLRVFDLANPSVEPRSRRLGDGVSPIELSPDGRLLAVLRKGDVELEDPLDGKVLTALYGGIKPGLAYHRFSADGRFFTGEAGGEMRVWETDIGRRIGQAPIKRSVTAIEPGRQGRYVAWTENDGRVGVLEPATGRVREFIPGSTSRRLWGGYLSTSSDETLLAVSQGWQPGGPQPAEVWSLASGHRVAVFPGRAGGGSIWFIPGRHDLLVADVSGPRIWRIDPPSAPDTLAGHADEAWAVAFSPDGKILATGSDDTDEPHTIKLWNPASGRLIVGWKAHAATVASLAFSPDGRVLASGSLDTGGAGHPNVILWDVASHEPLAKLEGHNGAVRSVIFSSDGRLLATAGNDATARLWDVAGKSPRAVLDGHTTKLTAIAFSSDGLLLASASNDGKVRLWDVASGKPRAILPHVANVNAVAFAPDGSLVASANERGEINLWAAPAGDLVRTIRGDAEQLRCVAFTPDGRSVVAAGKGKVIRVWDIATGLELLSLEGHKAQINALAFSPEGSILASCSHDGAVKLWRAEPSEPPPAH